MTPQYSEDQPQKAIEDPDSEWETESLKCLKQ